jgi:hypothetical protein
MNLVDHVEARDTARHQERPTIFWWPQYLSGCQIFNKCNTPGSTTINPPHMQHLGNWCTHPKESQPGFHCSQNTLSVKYLEHAVLAYQNISHSPSESLNLRISLVISMRNESSSPLFQSSNTWNTSDGSHQLGTLGLTQCQLTVSKRRSVLCQNSHTTSPTCMIFLNFIQFLIFRKRRMCKIWRKKNIYLFLEFCRVFSKSGKICTLY